MKKPFKKLLKFIKKNFEFSVGQKMTRLEAWRKDTKIKVKEVNNKWIAVGNNTSYIYRDNMTKDFADKYAEELNRNKKID